MNQDDFNAARAVQVPEEMLRYDFGALRRMQEDDLCAISEPDTPLPRLPLQESMCKECLDYKRRLSRSWTLGNVL